MDHTVPTLRQRTEPDRSTAGAGRPETAATAATAAADGPVVLGLDDPDATRAELAGAKAANLAAARRAGLPTLPGMVLTTVGASALFSTAEPPPPVAAALRRAWEAVSQQGRRAVVVRSSSTIEDAGASSMAGRFTSLLDVRGWDDLLAAVRTVLDSATSPELSDAPMAVLIQPFLTAARGGVLFGADPVTGNAEHLVVSSVDGGPDQLVGGTVDGDTTTLDRRGRLVAGSPLDRRTRRRLAGLARRTEAAFGGPQDVEWALDAEGALWLLQSRPITTPVHHPTGARLGPGPVAETLPGVLSPLEADLWVDPLRRGLREALTLSAAVAPGALRRSPVLVTVGGQVAVDLDVVEPPPRRGLLGKIDPRPGARRLRAAWRVGRLRAALPGLGLDVVADIDRQLLDVPPLGELTDRQLAGILPTTREALAALHGHEVLTGLLLGDGHDVDDVPGSGPSGAAVALQALAEGRAAGLDDEDIVARDPVVLALLPPRVGPAPELPGSPGRPGSPAGAAERPDAPGASGASDVSSAPDGPDAATVREALRLRARWVQELAAAAAWELAGRLHAAGRLDDPELVRWLTLDELEATVAGAPAPPDLARRRPAGSPDGSATAVAASPGATPRGAPGAGPQPVPVPLPASFRLTAEGAVVPDAASGEAQGAGGGRGQGRVHLGPDPAPGDVLVVRTLDPALAPVLPGLGGLVAETGSPLSHLAILAREHGVPTVVGLAGALHTFAAGELVDVDGTAGTVTLVPATPTAAPTPTTAPTAEAGASAAATAAPSGGSATPDTTLDLTGDLR